MMCHAHNSARVEAINTTPFEAMMGRAAPSIVDHIVQPTHGQSPSEFGKQMAANIKATSDSIEGRRPCPGAQPCRAQRPIKEVSTTIPSAMDRVASSAAEQRGTCQTESTVR
eukprot:m.619277 g.619277  ORF g.619277 m.619277 type:complete len:112 (-) comp58197_c0_seq5:517-852(-)